MTHPNHGVRSVFGGLAGLIGTPAGMHAGSRLKGLAFRIAGKQRIAPVLCCFRHTLDLHHALIKGTAMRRGDFFGGWIGRGLAFLCLIVVAPAIVSAGPVSYE